MFLFLTENEKWVLIRQPHQEVSFMIQEVLSALMSHISCCFDSIYMLQPFTSGGGGGVVLFC